MSEQRFNGANAALVLIDHQEGTIGWVNSIAHDVLRKNTALLARVATILGMPIVMTSSMEAFVQGPIIKELVEIAPEAHARRIQRMGIINAMDDGDFAAAVHDTGRRNIVLAGVTNDVCTIFPALTLVEEGFNVQVVADAGGSPSAIGEEMALRRMEQAGVMLTATNQIVAELTGSWSTEEGGRIVQLMMAAVA
ncbi:isochorismatase family protein [Novosphingobium sp.]|uniref:isochorismatase family protein n=1 Tax=Novosphingobium sp. TaxID=1874826 RepID=UPI003BAC199A